MTALLAQLISLIGNLLILLIIVYVLLSYVLSPYHPIRVAVERIIDPLLRPIRQVMPSTGGFDFSPVILMFLIYIVERLLLQLLTSF